MVDNATLWDEAAALVREHTDELRAIEGHRGLYRFATEHGFANDGAHWVKFRTELNKQLGIDYTQLRDEALEAEAAEMLAVADGAPHVGVSIAADAEQGRFAVVARTDEDQAWFGTFHEHDFIYEPGDDLSAERSAAEKAIFLAGKLREQLDVGAVTATLYCTHPELRARDLAKAGLKHKVAVQLSLEPSNAAVEYLAAGGFTTWRDIKLETLLDEPEPGDQAAAS